MVGRVWLQNVCAHHKIVLGARNKLKAARGEVKNESQFGFDVPSGRIHNVMIMEWQSRTSW
jgi:hypothetical protein